jgi:Flp pilus assembly protein TadD
MEKSIFETALAHHQADRLPEAERLYRLVLKSNPNHADALNLLGVLAAQIGRYDDAVELIGRACSLCPKVFDYRKHLGGALSEKKDFPAAVVAYRHALELNPGCYISHDLLGAALRETGELEEAQASHRRSLAINPGNITAHLNLGLTLRKQGLIRESMASYRQAIAIDPQGCDAHWNLSVLLLLTGDYEQGWREYEWRLERKTFTTLWPPLSQPRWNGQDLAGRTLLIHTEQGFGDAIQFVRYIPLLAARGARVILLCQPQLARLLESVDGVDQIVPGISSPADLPPFDLHCPMMSLPFLLGTRLETVPAGVPYLRANPSLLEHWLAKVNAAGCPGKKIGLVWAGNPEHVIDACRSSRLADFAPLAGVDATFFSLQKGPASSQAAAAPTGMKLIDLTQDLHDFADTAALVSGLDLVITVDTAVAHLAGALGKPAWVLIATEHDWRWLQGRDDSPWYPTVRLFRQQSAGQWPPVVERITRELADYQREARLAA